MCISSPFPDNKEMAGPPRLMGGQSRGPGSGLRAPSERCRVTRLVLPQSRGAGTVPAGHALAWLGGGAPAPGAVQHRRSILTTGASTVLPCEFPVTPNYTPESQDREMLASKPPQAGFPPNSVPQPFLVRCFCGTGRCWSTLWRFQNNSHTTHLNERRNKMKA